MGRAPFRSRKSKIFPSFLTELNKIMTKWIKTRTNILWEKTHAVEKMAHTMRSPDILLASAKKDSIVMAHKHTTNKETAGERSWKQSLNQEAKNVVLHSSILYWSWFYTLCQIHRLSHDWLNCVGKRGLYLLVSGKFLKQVKFIQDGLHLIKTESVLLTFEIKKCYEAILK